MECKIGYNKCNFRQRGNIMSCEFAPMKFEKVFNVTDIFTLFYMEISKDFLYDGESHDFWEMVYIDKGEVVCTADKKRFVLKSGEMVFHKPNEFHNLSGNGSSAPNVSIITFKCSSKAMKNFESKIFKLSAPEKNILSQIFEEGTASFKLKDEHNPLLQIIEKREDAPFGASQITKNLLEVFLIRLCRNTNVVYKKQRMSYLIEGEDISYNVKEILDILKSNVYEKLTVGDIAKILDKSPSAIKQSFTLYKKGGIMKYYTYLKVKEAKKLIREGKYNMTQISDMLCFDNPQYFAKCFKRYVNMTPSEYKKSIVTH